jgi:L-gulonolactone oxidase
MLVAMWTNWAGDQRCDPAAIVRPEHVEGLSEAIVAAARAGRTVRAVGAGHSFNDAACTGGTMVSLERMDRVLDVDRSSGLVRVEAGITLHALSLALAGHGLALENLGDIDAQSVGGAIATATHGTGARLRNLSSQVVELDLVTADGSVMTARAGEDDDLVRAARVSIGALGIVSMMTLRCVPAFTLRGVDRPQPLDEVLEHLDELVDGNDHFELFAFPHCDDALTRTNTRVDEPPRPPGAARAWAQDVLLANHALGLLCRAGRRFPSQIPRLNRLVTRLAGTTVRTDASHRVFATPRLVRFTEMEYALPRSAAVPVIRAIRELVESGGMHVNFPIEMRFVAPDDAFLSPATGRDTVYVAVHMFRGMPWEPFFHAVEEIAGAHGGRPHWGKRHAQTAATLAPRYPEWDRFTAVRRRLDPHGVFENDHVRRVLGPVAAPPPVALLA